MPEERAEGRRLRNDIADFLAVSGGIWALVGIGREAGRTHAAAVSVLVRPALQPKLNCSKNSPRKLRDSVGDPYRAN